MLATADFFTLGSSEKIVYCASPWAAEAQDRLGHLPAAELSPITRLLAIETPRRSTLRPNRIAPASSKWTSGSRRKRLKVFARIWRGPR